MLLLSPYERKARLIPGLMGIAPIAFTIATLGFERFPAVASALALVSAGGGAYLLAVKVADLGRQAQVKLWREWDGPPATRLLRTREVVDNPKQRELWRKAISHQTGIRLFTPAEEATDTQGADQTIDAAVDQVLHYGQNKQFPTLLSENAQYGLQRNLYGFRWVGCSIALVCIIGLVITDVWTDWVSRDAVIAGIVLNCLILIFWLVVPSKRGTKDAGDRYAKQLMRAVVQAHQSNHTLSPEDAPNAEREA